MLRAAHCIKSHSTGLPRDNALSIVPILDPDRAGLGAQLIGRRRDRLLTIFKGFFAKRRGIAPTFGKRIADR